MTRVSATSVSSAIVLNRRVSLRLGRRRYVPGFLPFVRLKTIRSLKNEGAISFAELERAVSFCSAAVPTSKR